MAERRAARLSRPHSRRRRPGKARYFRAFTEPGLIGMVRRVAAGKGRFVVLNQRLNAKTARRQGSRYEDSHRQQQPPAGRSHCRQARLAAGQGQHPPLLGQRDLRRDPGKRARRGHVRAPVDQFPGQRPSDGAADHHRCAAPQLGAAHHRGDALLRLCPAGPQDRLAHADLGQAGGQPADQCRRQPRAHARPACRPDPGLFRHPRRQPLCRPGVQQGHQGNPDKP